MSFILKADHLDQNTIIGCCFCFPFSFSLEIDPPLQVTDVYLEMT